MNLNVPLFRQKPKTADCWLYCLKMVMEYFWDSIEIEDIRNNIDIDQTGICIWELWNYLLQKGYKVSLITRDPKIFSHNDEISPPNNFNDFFKKINYFDIKTIADKESFFYLKKFVSSGWNITIKIPNQSDIQKNIETWSLMISIMTYKFLFHDTPKFDFHYNVITGIDENHIYANDPGSTYGGKQKYSIESFFYALYATAFSGIGRASLLCISKNDK